MDGAQYMLIDAGPDESLSFDFTKSKRLYPGNCRRLLEALGPPGIMAPEMGQCQMIVQPTPAKLE